MKQTLPKVIPINELKNTAQIAKTCQESDVPILITKNGYSEMVLMSIKLYEEIMAKVQVAALINESLEDKNKEKIEGKEFFEKMRKKYE